MYLSYSPVGCQKTLSDGVNMPIQGTAADMIKLAIIELDETNPHPESWLMLLTVHDDIKFQCPTKDVKRLVAWAKPVMEGVLELRVPVVVDVKYGKSLAKMRKVA